MILESHLFWSNYPFPKITTSTLMPLMWCQPLVNIFVFSRNCLLYTYEFIWHSCQLWVHIFNYWSTSGCIFGKFSNFARFKCYSKRYNKSYDFFLKKKKFKANLLLTLSLTLLSPFIWLQIAPIGPLFRFRWIWITC